MNKNTSPQYQIAHVASRVPSHHMHPLVMGAIIAIFKHASPVDISEKFGTGNFRIAWRAFFAR